MARVLLVEDDVVTALYFQQLLAAAGHTVTTCMGGAEAIQLCAMVEPDVIVTDYRMPGVDGAGFIAWMRQSAQAHLPVILITGVAREELPPMIASDLLLSKPFHDEELLRTVQIIVSRAARREPAGAVAG